METGDQKALSHQAIVKLKPNDELLCDCNENRGLRVECLKTDKNGLYIDVEELMVN